jgi:hypothetical protein
MDSEKCLLTILTWKNDLLYHLVLWKLNSSVWVLSLKCKIMILYAVVLFNLLTIRTLMLKALELRKELQ